MAQSFSSDFKLNICFKYKNTYCEKHQNIRKPFHKVKDSTFLSFFLSYDNFASECENVSTFKEFPILLQYVK